jgi:hypothetical protein
MAQRIFERIFPAPSKYRSARHGQVRQKMQHFVLILARPEFDEKVLCVDVLDVGWQDYRRASSVRMLL